MQSGWQNDKRAKEASEHVHDEPARTISFLVLSEAASCSLRILSQSFKNKSSSYDTNICENNKRISQRIVMRLEYILRRGMYVGREWRRCPGEM